MSTEHKITSEPLVTILIPCYEMKGFGVKFLNFSLEKIYRQNYKNIIVLITDQSEDSSIKNEVNEWKEFLNIEYLYSNKTKRRSSANINYALQRVNKDSKYIKFLFQDDFLFNDESIKETIIEFEKYPEKKWLISSCCHSKNGNDLYYFHEPYYYDEIYLGEPNSISSPSVLTIKNNLDIFFDEELFWLMDVDYYKRLNEKFDSPVILKNTTVVNRVWDGQVGNSISNEVRNFEINHVKNKFKK